MFFSTHLVSSAALAIHLLTNGMLVNALPALPSDPLDLPSRANSTLEVTPTNVAFLVKRDDLPSSASASLSVDNGTANLTSASLVALVFASATPSIAVRQVNSTEILSDANASSSAILANATASPSLLARKALASDAKPKKEKLMGDLIKAFFERRDVNSTVASANATDAGLEATSSAKIAARGASALPVVASGAAIPLDFSVVPTSTLVARNATPSVALPIATNNVTVLEAPVSVVARDVSALPVESESAIALSATATPSLAVRDASSAFPLPFASASAVAEDSGFVGTVDIGTASIEFFTSVI
ncbi:hypothetical protein SCHPADRAFT_900594 [Schizopora paradoxa]|uniref:Uncharacterized protein n=1 Tax=Schizopora paradoxa TaxID=27342 RepID=A0A0H2S0J9_9AGAM|nr:hypothetical protein SCHPADRAFT_900594 [Schizopora paradoxa]